MCHSVGGVNGSCNSRAQLLGGTNDIDLELFAADAFPSKDVATGGSTTTIVEHMPLLLAGVLVSNAT